MVPIVAPRGSEIVVQIYQDSILVSTDTIVTEKRRTELQIVPLPGSSELVLEMTDEDGNIHRNRLLVTGSVPEETDAMEIPDELLIEEEPVSPTELDLENPVGMLLYEIQSNSEGELQNYLLQLDLEAEGIRSSEELLVHLESVAEKEGFSMDEVRKAMPDSQGRSPEVYQLYEEALQRSEGDAREMLESIDIKASGITTTEELILLLDSKLQQKGISKKEREQILSELFGDQYSRSGSGPGRKSWPLVAVLALAVSGLAWFFIAWWRRREKGEKKGG
jgi:hypothetical protein